MTRIIDILRLIIIVALALVIILLANGLIWWGVGALFVYVFDIPYVWTFAKAFTLGLVLFAISPGEIKFNTDDLVRRIAEDEEDDDIE